MNNFEKLNILISNMLQNNPPEAPTWNTERIGVANWNYINGCMLKAFKDLYDVTKKDIYMNFNKNFIDYYVNDKGEILYYPLKEYNLDNINSGKVLFSLYEKTGNKKYKLAADLLHTQLQGQPRTNSGNYFHKERYPGQIWLDGLYMAMPFYMEYEIKYNNSEHCQDIYNQFTNVYKLLRNTETKLYYHGYDESKVQDWANKDTGLSSEYWLRSVAWFAMALVDTAELKPDDNTLQPIMKELFETLEKYQDKTGMWYQVIDKADFDGNFLETSGSSGVSYAMMKAARLGFVDSHFYEVGKKAFDGICENKLIAHNNGSIELKDICIVCGLGGMLSSTAINHPKRDGSYEYYISEKTASNDAKGVAPLLFAYTEVIRHN